MTVLTVLLPTFNEAANIGPLVGELRQALAGVDHEVLVVDDDSPDGTARQAQEAGARVVVRRGERGLATAVVRGIEEARGTFVCVMDADGQHPVEAVRRMHDAALGEDVDLVVGSRTAPGGSVGGFGPVRRLISWGAASIARVALPPVREHGLTDPMSGLFLVRRDRVDTAALRPHGYKVLLEIVARAPLRRVVEVGYTFRSRRAGDSKLGGAVVLQFLAHAAALAWVHPENRRMARFGLVGLSGVVVNLAVLWALVEHTSLPAVAAAAVAIEVSVISNFVLNDAFTFHDRRHRGFWARLARFQSVSLAALAVNLAVFAILHEALGVYYLLAEAVAIGVAFTTNYLGNLNWTYGGGLPRGRIAWVPFVLIVAGAGWLYAHDLDDIPELYFDETYYLAVAKQMENGVWEDPCWDRDALPHRPLNFEHPPLAKLIMASSTSRLDTYHGVFDGCRDPESQGFKDWTAAMKDEGNPVAWRLPSALMATLTVLGAGLAAGRLFGGAGPAAAAALFVAADGLALTSGRVAILDGFAAGFLALAVWAATYPTRRGVLATGLLLGLAFACKYTTVFAGPGLLLLVLWVHWRAGVLRKRRFDLALAALVGIPLLVWLVTYTPWLVRWIPEHGLGWTARHMVEVTAEAIGWGAAGGGGDPHAYESKPLQWITFERPVFYYGGAEHAGVKGYIFAFGNPVAWWAASASAVFLIVHTTIMSVWSEIRYRRTPWAWFRGLTPAHQGLVMVSLLAVSAFCGFLIPDRSLFMFYMTLLVPLVAIVGAGVVASAWRTGMPGAAAAAVVVLLVVAAAVHYYPVWVAEPITGGRFDLIFDTVPWMRKGPTFGD